MDSTGPAVCVAGRACAYEAEEASFTRIASGA